MKSIQFIFLILLSLNSAYGQFEITAIPLPDIINSHDDSFVFRHSPMISPDGKTLIYSIVTKTTGFDLFQSQRISDSWSKPNEILGNLSGEKILAGFNGSSLFFRIDSVIYKSNFDSGSFGLALPYKFPENINYPYNSSYLFAVHHFYLGNPHKLFYSLYPDNQTVFEYYFSNTETMSPKILPKSLIGNSQRERIVIGNNGILFREKKGLMKSEPYILFSIKEQNSWSSPFKITISNFTKKQIQNTQITSYSEATNEIFLVLEQKIYNAKLPEQLIKLINTNYPSVESIPESSLASTSQTTETSTKPKFYALLIAVEDYQHDEANLIDLSNPITDAERLKRELIENYSFEEENFKVLRNPNRATIINSFEALANQLTEKDNLLIFYAGHGIWDKKLNIGYWLSSDATTKSKTNWISNSTIRDYIAGLPAKHTLLISDACFSGSIFKTREVTHSIDDYGFSRLYKLPSRKAMTSGTLNTVPDESKFMKYLLKALAGNDKEYLPSKQLFHQIEIAIINNTSNVPQFGTIQNTGDEGGDFIFIREKKNE